MRRHPLAGLALAAGVAVTGCERTTTETDESPAAAPSAGGASADAAVAEIRPVTPAELDELIAQNKGKAVFVDFWATWCVPCVQQYPHTVELSTKHAQDLVVYTVSMDETDDESFASVKEFVADHGTGRTVPLRSSDGGSEEAYIGFEITGGALPHYKVYGRDGELAAMFGGDVDKPLDVEEIEAAVAEAVRK